MVFNLISDSPKAQLAVLIDPDKVWGSSLDRLIAAGTAAGVDMYLVGGSLLMGNRFSEVVAQLKAHAQAPVVLFPGNNFQVDANADALLMLSLVSGRNPEYLIGQHVAAAPRIKQAGLEVIPTAYIHIDGGTVSTTLYMTNTQPIPGNKPEVAAATAMAAEMLGMRLVYLEAGSGATFPVGQAVITAVRKSVDCRIMVGGGIRTAEQAAQACKAGADVVVVGTLLEHSVTLLGEIANAVHSTLKLS